MLLNFPNSVSIFDRSKILFLVEKKLHAVNRKAEWVENISKKRGKLNNSLRRRGIGKYLF